MTREDPLSELKNRTWLSEWIRAEVEKQYPRLALSTRRQKLISRLEDYWRLSLEGVIIASVILFILFFIFNELLLAGGITPFFYKLDSESTNEILGSFIDALAAMIGIVIPLTILVIEFLGRDSGDVIDIYLDMTEIKIVALSALIVLALHGVTKLLVGANLIPTSSFYFYALVLLGMLDLAVLFGVGRVLNKVRRSLNNDFFVEAFLRRIEREVRESQRNEVEYRYSRIAQTNIGRIFALRRSFLPLPSSNLPPNTMPLVASKSGAITDVHILKWIAFGQSLKATLDSDPTLRGYIVRLIGDVVSEGDPVAYVASTEGQNAEDLQLKLDESLKIQKGALSQGTDISRLLRHLKTKTRLAVREEDDVLFDQFLDVYLSIFDLGIDLPAPPSDSPVPQPFSGWNVIATIVFHLRETIDVAAQSRNDHFVRGLAFRLSLVVEAIIQRSDSYVSESLRDILGLFATMYFYSRQYGNHSGMTRSFSYLSKRTIDHAWISKFEGAYASQEALHNLKGILSSIFYVLVSIAQSMIEYHDLNNLKTLLNRLRPDEFLPVFYPVWQQIVREKWELEWQLRNAHQEDSSYLAAQLEVRNSALNTRHEVGELFDQLIFVAASYVVDRYTRDEIDPIQAKQALDVLYSYFVPFNRLVAIFSTLIESEGWAWKSFHRHPDTKHAYSPDDEAKFYLFYCLRGAELRSSGEISDNLPSVDLQHQLPRIESFCNTIADNPDKWSSILEGVQDMPTAASQFFELNQQIAEDWQRDREDKVIQAALDPAKVLAFQDAFEAAHNSTPGLRAFLESQGRVSYDVTVPGKKVLRIDECGEGKEHFTSLSPYLEYAKRLGDQYGRRLANSEDHLLVSEWLKRATTLPSRKDWPSLEPYIERSLAHMNANGREANLIIVPSGLMYTVFQQMPEFRNVHDLESPLKLLHLRGFYNEIPLLEWPDPLDYRILVVDAVKASQFEIEYIEAEVKPLPDSSIKRILREKPSYSERQLQLCIWVLISEKARVRILDRSAIVKLQIKLPDNMWFRRRKDSVNELSPSPD